MINLKLILKTRLQASDEPPIRDPMQSKAIRVIQKVAEKGIHKWNFFLLKQMSMFFSKIFNNLDASN